MTTGATNLEALQRAFAAIGRGDVDAMLANYTEDLVMELPYADPPKVLVGRSNVHTALTAAFGVFRFGLELTAVHECADPNQLVAEYVSDGAVSTTGKAYANTYIGVYWFRDGAISKVREFYNPLISAKALEP